MGNQKVREGGARNGESKHETRLFRRPRRRGLKIRGRAEAEGRRGRTWRQTAEGTAPVWLVGAGRKDRSSLIPRGTAQPAGWMMATGYRGGQSSRLEQRLDSGHAGCMCPSRTWRCVQEGSVMAILGHVSSTAWRCGWGHICKPRPRKRRLARIHQACKGESQAWNAEPN